MTSPDPQGDARAIKAMAHPARYQVFAELQRGAVLTATQAATFCGLSPSAMSYHLRALEKFGLVLRDDQHRDGDGRERPWRAVPGATFPTMITAADEADATVTRHSLRLTTEQAAALDARISDVIAEFDALPEPADDPAAETRELVMVRTDASADGDEIAQPVADPVA